jgi:hypothetical protein
MLRSNGNVAGDGIAILAASSWHFARSSMSSESSLEGITGPRGEFNHCKPEF